MRQGCRRTILAEPFAISKDSPDRRGGQRCRFWACRSEGILDYCCNSVKDGGIGIWCGSSWNACGGGGLAIDWT